MKKLAKTLAMNRTTLTACVLSLATLALAACQGKEPEPQTVPLPTASAVASVAADPVPPSSAAPTVADTSGAAANTAPVTPPTDATPKPTGGGSIDACCSALDGIAKSGKDAVSKAKAASASAVCKSLAKSVKDGSANRARALTTVRASLQGTEIPGACN